VLFAGKHPAIVSQIKLSEFHRGSRTWRLLRGLLLQLSRVTTRVPQWVIQFVGRLERWEPRRLEKCYTLAIDYLYWYGVFGAMREQRAGSTMEPLPLGAHPSSQRSGET